MEYHKKKDEITVFPLQSQASRRERDFVPLNLRVQDPIKNFVTLVSEIEIYMF